MPELGPYGSVRGALSNERPYRDLRNVAAGDDLIRLTAKRSVFSAKELREMNASERSPVKMIDFLLVGHSQPPVHLNALVQDGVFSGRPPQSIAELGGEQYRRLRPHIRLGFGA
jgi:hypothetical protein